MGVGWHISCCVGEVRQVGPLGSGEPARASFMPRPPPVLSVPFPSMSSFLRHFQALARTIDQATTPLRWSDADFDESLYHFLATRMHALDLVTADAEDGEIVVHELTSDGRELLSESAITEDRRKGIQRALDAADDNRLG